MDLIKQLQDIGYSEAQATEIATKSRKVYFQEDMDNITAKVKSTVENQYSKNYIPKSEYDLLSAENLKMKTDLKQNTIRDLYIKNGGNEKYFNDFLKVNQGLLDQEGKTLENSILETKKNNSWAYGKETPTLADFGKKDNVVKEPEVQGLYARDWGEKIE